MSCGINSGIGIDCNALKRVGGISKTAWIFNIDDLISYTIGSDGCIAQLNFAPSTGLYEFSSRKKSHSGGYLPINTDGGNKFFQHDVQLKLFSDSCTDDQVIEDLLVSCVGIILETNNKQFKIYGRLNGMSQTGGSQNTGQSSASDISDTLIFQGNEIDLPGRILDTDYATTKAYIESLVYVPPSPWNVNNATLSTSISISEDEGLSGMFFKADGLKMYLIGNSNDKVYEYDLSGAWDITTTVYLQEFSVSGQDSFFGGLFFKADGLKMYVTGSNNDSVYEYDLSVAWDITTAVYLQPFVISEDTFPTNVFFKPDGLKMYVTGSTNGKVYEYDLSVAWDITTAVYNSISLDVSSKESSPRDLYLRSDGLNLYVTGFGSNSVHQYAMSSAWDLSTASFVESFDASAQSATTTALYFKDDGLKMYIADAGDSPDTVYEYDL